MAERGLESVDDEVEAELELVVDLCAWEQFGDCGGRGVGARVEGAVVVA
jgi:hypothetical protein